MSKGKKRRAAAERRAMGILPGNREARLQALLAKYLPDTPRETMLDISGTGEAVEIRAFRHWVNGRDIPIDDLCLLFNRDKATIRRWLASKE